MGIPSRARAQVAAPAIGKGQTLTVSLWGGITEDSVRRLVQPEFERQTGAKMAYDIGSQGARVNKVLAQRSTPPCDVIFTTDEAVITGYSEGVFTPVRKKNVPNLASVFDWAFTVKGYDTEDAVAAVPYTVISSVIAYNPELVKTPPTSYADFWRPELKGKISLTAPTGSSAPAFIINTAELFGGSMTNPDPAFKKLAELRPARLTLFWTDWAPLAKTGEVVMSTELDYYVEAMKTQGYPIDYVVPKERSPALSEFMSMVKGTKNPELAEAFMNLMLDPKPQEGFAVETYQGSVNKTVKMTPAVAARCACGPKVETLRFFDPKFIMSVRPEWVERMNAEVLPNWSVRK